MSTLHNLLPERRPTTRRFAHGTALWVFGLALSVVLGSLWGRAVTGDEETLSEAATAAANADWVAVQISAWLGDAVAEQGVVPERQASAAIRAVWQQPEARAAVQDLIAQGVAAGLAPPGTSVKIDAAAAMLPLADEVAAALNQAGVPTTPAEVAGFLAGIEPVVAVAAPGQGAGSLRQVRGFLTMALLGAAVVMALAAAAALALSEDHWATVRGLAMRATLTALGFAVLLRVSAWALDPSGGAAPLREGGSVLLGSNLGVLWWFAAAAALPTAGAALAVRGRKRSSPA